MLKKGKDAPDIRLKTPEGNVKPLSSLEGKVVLVDFWASWCKPCIRTIPKLKKVYKKYNDQGFEIYGVSLDKKRKSWEKAIDKHGMNWVHVSDLKYFNSAAAQKYKIKSIPFTVLVDRDGKIIASGLRGQELVEKIEEVMG
jgi:peroxiredoxin